MVTNPTLSTKSKSHLMLDMLIIKQVERNSSNYMNLAKATTWKPSIIQTTYSEFVSRRNYKAREQQAKNWSKTVA